MQSYDFSRLSVLLIDDNPFIRRTVRLMLKSIGVGTVLEASDGAEAFGALRSSQVDVVLVDWMMDPLDGHDLVLTLRRSDDSPAPRVPVIMMTGHTERWRVERARDAGITEFLAKPVSAAVLVDRLLAVVERPRSFVAEPGYAGPDRRRSRHGDPRRRRAGDAPEAGAAALTREEIQALLGDEG